MGISVTLNIMKIIKVVVDLVCFGLVLIRLVCY